MAFAVGLPGTFGVLLILTGCAGPRVAASEHARGAVSARAIMGIGAGTDVRTIYDTGDGAGLEGGEQTLGPPIGTERTAWTFDEGIEDGAGRWTVRTETLAPDGSVERERSAGHVVGPFGGVYLSWSRSKKDTDPDGPSRLYVFEPALIWVPSAVDAGMVFEDRTTMTERDPDDESRVTLRGTAVRRVAIIDSSSAHWPFATPRGEALLTELRVKVGPAQAVRRRVVLIDDAGRGGEAFEDYGVRVLGVPITRERRRLGPPH